MNSRSTKCFNDKQTSMLAKRRRRFKQGALKSEKSLYGKAKQKIYDIIRIMANRTNEVIDLCVAKLSEDENGKPIGLGMSVQTHCILTGLTARELLNRMPQSYKKLFPAWYPINVALHDIGKINPLFQEKIRRKIDSYIPNSEPLLKDADPEKEKQTGYHGGVSYLTILDEFDDKPLATIAGSHHGYAPDLPDMDATDKRIGGRLWEKCPKGSNRAY